MLELHGLEAPEFVRPNHGEESDDGDKDVTAEIPASTERKEMLSSAAFPSEFFLVPSGRLVPSLGSSFLTREEPAKFVPTGFRVPPFLPQNSSLYLTTLRFST